ncbi:fungal specific transcription factor domain-containing protein [Aspergillus ibericus CBS 121593]|uniref:Xylanolytic transcriptional activator regulatory domain-containing protein n=1 Tax=Aspergillus ibericus CBS 121593 TaxID=1448316 RepID=A0A395GKV7_9EURO|nr:hypothetical protein BO80DRAFT_368763 [Aspergillus ibericus CBS 121593]RAK95437.1 hypothetical protein BO80DRAFT_368763 [Aspergillus ibericus CBS 121593]
MKQRIDHLEELVTRLIREREFGEPSTPESQRGEVSMVRSDASEVAYAGTTVMDGVRSVYRGGDEWEDVLVEINALKKSWTETHDNPTDGLVRPTCSHTVDGSSLLFGQVKPLERIEIISTLPPKHQADKLISQFFDRDNFPISLPPILHQPTFMREYNEHWKDPSRTNFIWLGLLFSILGITMLSYLQFGEPPEYEGISESLFQLYRIRTAQCLLSGDIAKCLPYTVEALRFNATAELNRKDDNRRGLWIMTGVIVRAAINMGYHRDPSHSPSIPPLQAEFRRRIWLSVISMDDMASFLGGFPRMSSAIYSDTREPQNLYDWELSDSSATLPPSRPLTEPTAATYLIVKSRLFRAIGRIADFNNTPTRVSYDTVREIDQAVYGAYDNFPSHMKIPPGGVHALPLKSAADFSTLNLAAMYHRSMCTLHRKFMSRGHRNNQCQLSRDRCISSALALLSYQEVLQPYWYKASQTRQMLSLAAMILLLELELRRRVPDEDVTPDSTSLLQTLERSSTLWENAKDSCDEAGRVYEILGGMVSGFQTSSASSSSHTVTPSSSLEIPGFDTSVRGNGEELFEKELASMDVDWATWDAFIQDTDFQDGPIY